jgi:hypothetical protein
MVAQVHAQGSPCGICGGQNDNVTGLPQSSSVFPINIIPPPLHIHSYHLGAGQRTR